VPSGECCQVGLGLEIGLTRRFSGVDGVPRVRLSAVGSVDPPLTLMRLAGAAQASRRGRASAVLAPSTLDRKGRIKTAPEAGVADRAPNRSTDRILDQMHCGRIGRIGDYLLAVPVNEG
jgi:hypothetical protein